MFQLEPITISTHYWQLYGSYGADKTSAFLRLVAKMSGEFIEQRINIKFCVKLGKNASDNRAMLFEAYGREFTKKSSVFE
jgi:isochorismate hydrolase